MIDSDYQVGQYVRIKGPCACKESVLKVPSNYCWHDLDTTVLRVFSDGALLLENRCGYVRLVQLDEVWC